ncbi:MAG: DUF72 domain-containing protein [Thermoleophilia bacterium]|nr:DUF72 domain-containing protein [Thermoleophilia bacterium]
MSSIRIGTSGWNYGHWRDIFYPPGLGSSEWLAHYARSFDTVEINATFYRLPKPEHVNNWASQTPPGFMFAVKGSRYLTHVKRLNMTGESVDRFFDLIGILGKKAGPVLWQLPPSMKRDDDRLAAFAGYLPGEWRQVFEFRHDSWYCQEVYDILNSAGAALCIPDHPERPSEIMLTADWTYLRFHYGEADGSYTEAELQGWADIIGKFTADGIDVHAYFNNDWQGHALRNARRLKELLGF